MHALLVVSISLDKVRQTLTCLMIAYRVTHSCLYSL